MGHTVNHQTPSIFLGHSSNLQPLTFKQYLIQQYQLSYYKQQLTKWMYLQNQLWFNPTKIQFIQPDNLCNSKKKIRLWYQFSSISLQDDISLRSKKYRSYSQKQILNMAKSCLIGLKQIYKVAQFYGKVRPKHIHLKGNQFIISNPGFILQTSVNQQYQVQLIGTNIYPAQKQYRINPQSPSMKSDIFSLGMCVLSAALLQPLGKAYLKDFRIDWAFLQRQLYSICVSYPYAIKVLNKMVNSQVRQLDDILNEIDKGMHCLDRDKIDQKSDSQIQTININRNVQGADLMTSTQCQTNYRNKLLKQQDLSLVFKVIQQTYNPKSHSNLLFNWNIPTTPKQNIIFDNRWNGINACQKSQLFQIKIHQEPHDDYKRQSYAINYNKPKQNIKYGQNNAILLQKNKQEQLLLNKFQNQSSQKQFKINQLQYVQIIHHQPHQLNCQLNYFNLNSASKFIFKYQGFSKHSLKQGKGKIYYTNGQTFQGVFSKDIPFGIGCFNTLDNQIIIGQWKQGILLI